jgi:hypothetical protein
MTPDRADHYRPHVGTPFELPGVPFSLVLEAVEAFETSATEGFSLRFTGPQSPLIPQGIRAMEHPSLGQFELFLVPVQDPRTDIHTYEAIFNRLRPPAQASTTGGA